MASWREQSVRVRAYLPRELAEWLEGEAARTGESVSGLVRDAVQRMRTAVRSGEEDGEMTWQTEMGDFEITREQVQLLRSEAGEAGDACMVDHCDRALQDDAVSWEVCRRAIWEAQAQS